MKRGREIITGWHTTLYNDPESARFKSMLDELTDAETIDIRIRNAYDRVSVRHIADALQHNTSWKSLTVSGREIPNTGVIALLSALHTNHTLLELSVSGSGDWKGDWRVVTSSMIVMLTSNFYIQNVEIFGPSKDWHVNRLLKRNRALRATALAGARTLHLIGRFRLGESNIPSGIPREIIYRIARLLKTNLV